MEGSEEIPEEIVTVEDLPEDFTADPKVRDIQKWIRSADMLGLLLFYCIEREK